MTSPINAAELPQPLVPTSEQQGNIDVDSSPFLDSELPELETPTVESYVSAFPIVDQTPISTEQTMATEALQQEQISASIFLIPKISF